MSQVLNPIEGLPSTGVYHSIAGKIMFGGMPIIRISRASFSFSNSVNLYTEVGSREGLVYAGPVSIRGSISRAYINGAEWKLAIGLKPQEAFPGNPSKFFVPGSIYSSDTDLVELVQGSKYSNSRREALQNTYPIKTEMMLQVNAEDKLQKLDGSAGFITTVLITGVMIDALSISVGSGGDLIQSGPIDIVGEEIFFGLDMITGSVGTPGITQSTDGT